MTLPAFNKKHLPIFPDNPIKNHENRGSMLRIGLTGGIGSGKTTVAKIFELLGIPVYYADDETKRIMNENEELKTAIKNKFGEESYTNGELNRPYLATKVFSDPYQLDILNALTHPVTIRDSAGWMSKQFTESGGKTLYVIKEAALIFESGAAENLDYVIGVYAPEPLRIQRAMKRTGAGREDVIKRMQRQLDEEIKMKLCDFILKNNEQELLIPQVLTLHSTLLELAKEKQRQP